MKNESEHKEILTLFNRIIFCGLILVAFILVVSPFLRLDEIGLKEFSSTDFENEVLGQAYFASLHKNYDQEIALYSKLINKLPELKTEIYPQIGNAFYNKGEQLEAIKFFNLALEENCKDSVSIFYGVAMVAHRLKKYDMAIKYYQKCTDDEATLIDANFNLGNIYFLKKNRNKQALAYYLKSIEEPSLKRLYRKMLRREMKVYTERKSPESYKNLFAEYYGNKDFFDKSAFDGKALLKNAWADNQAITHNYIGTIYAMDQKYDLALQYYQKAIQIDPDFKDAVFNLQKMLKQITAENNEKLKKKS